MAGLRAGRPLFRLGSYFGTIRLRSPAFGPKALVATCTLWGLLWGWVATLLRPGGVRRCLAPFRASERRFSGVLCGSGGYSATSGVCSGLFDAPGRSLGHLTPRFVEHHGRPGFLPHPRPLLRRDSRS